MKYYVTQQSSQNSFRAPESGPWVEFFRAISEEGNEFVALEENPDVVVFMNNHSNLHKELNRRKSKSLRILVLWEPKVTRPSNFDSRILQEFNRIFSPSELWISGSNVEYFSWPQSAFNLWKSKWIDWEQRRNRILAFQSNKFSFVNGEMYSLRREVVKKLTEDIDLFGVGWGTRRHIGLQLGKAAYNQYRWNGFREWKIPRHCFFEPSNYRGYTVEKMKLLLESKFSLVIENSQDYISEKLFESAVTGNIAIYVGPKLSTFGLPRLAIEAQDSVSGVLEAIERARTDENLVVEIRKTISEYLSSDHYLAMKNDLVLKTLANRIMSVADIHGRRER